MTCIMSFMRVKIGLEQSQIRLPGGVQSLPPVVAYDLPSVSHAHTIIEYIANNLSYLF